MRWEGRAAGEAALDAAEAGVRGVLGAAVVTPVGGDGGRGLVEVVVDLLASRGETLAVVESCTGGLLGSMVTAVAGSSAVFTGGWVTYTNAMKASAVGVDRGLFPEVVAGAPGAVSAEVAVVRAGLAGGMSVATRACAPTLSSELSGGGSSAGGGSDDSEY